MRHARDEVFNTSPTQNLEKFLYTRSYTLAYIVSGNMVTSLRRSEVSKKTLLQRGFWPKERMAQQLILQHRFRAHHWNSLSPLCKTFCTP
uniref:Uncharacterized protein LOC105628461 n=1 Tax=Rhizophora mucronata TaxID=61149 RepID=A0A2P2JN50_RHIMU